MKVNIRYFLGDVAENNRNFYKTQKRVVVKTPRVSHQTVFMRILITAMRPVIVRRWERRNTCPLLTLIGTRRKVALSSAARSLLDG